MRVFPALEAVGNKVRRRVSHNSLVGELTFSP